MKFPEKTPWDPVYLPFAVIGWENRNARLLAQIERWKKPKYIVRWKTFWLWFAIIGVGVALAAVGFPSEMNIPFLLGFFAVIPYANFNKKLRKYYLDSLMVTIADKRGWLCWDGEGTARPELERTFTAIFNPPGSKERIFGKAYWGDFAFGGKKMPFWLSEFAYSTELGRLKSRNNKKEIPIARHVYSQFAFAVKLEKPVPLAVTLVPQTPITTAKNAATKTDLSLESAEFNAAFHIEFPGEVSLQNKQLVFQVLNPSVMERLLQLREKYGEFRITCVESMVIGCFENGAQFEPKQQYTNFKISPEIDERDIALFDEVLADILLAASALSGQFD